MNAPAQQLSQEASAALQDTQHLAPLPGSPAPEAGSTTTKFEITWDAVILPKAAPAGGAS